MEQLKGAKVYIETGTSTKTGNEYKILKIQLDNPLNQNEPLELASLFLKTEHEQLLNLLTALNSK